MILMKILLPLRINLLQCHESKLKTTRYYAAPRIVASRLAPTAMVIYLQCSCNMFPIKNETFHKIKSVLCKKDEDKGMLRSKVKNNDDMR